MTLRRQVERKISVETSHGITKYSENQLSSTVAHAGSTHFWNWKFGSKSDLSAKLSTHMVYITTAKRIKGSEKPIVTFQKKISIFFVGGGGPPLGDCGGQLYMCTVFGSSKTQFSKPLAKGQLSRIGWWEVMNLCGWSIYRGYGQYSLNLLQQTTPGKMVVSSCGFDSALIN